MNNINIKLANNKYLSEYTYLLQKTYQESYVNNEIGLTKDCFSEEIFNTPDTQKYLKSNLINNKKQKSWLAFDEEKLIGSINIIERENDYELKGFYVASKYQGKGIGKELWEIALDYAKKDITLDIYAHNTKTIQIYKKWGFEIDIEKGEFYRHWPEWPEKVKAKCIYMRYKKLILEVPFYSNTKDNTHCFQASMKSVLKYFLPDINFTLKELDKLSNKKEGLWTWSQRAKINMHKMGFKIVEIENWDINEFVTTGKKYLIKRFGKEIADIQEKNSNLKLTIKDYEEYGNLNILEKRLPEIKDIQIFLNNGYLVCINVNSKKLNDKQGYCGHFVTVVGFDHENLFLHDPGLPPHKNRKVKIDKFLESWAYPNIEAKNLTAFKFNGK